MAVDAAPEILRCGQWSVRRLRGDSGLVYVDVETGELRTEPPREVLFALELGGEEEDGEELQDCDKAEVSASDGEAGPVALQSPRYKRIVLGASCGGLPLTMARDILKVLREDGAVFDSIQQRFSEHPRETPRKLSEFEDLSADAFDAVSELEGGSVSDILQSECGVQIFMRIQ